jgi:ketosteroid isomerase-like protein
MLKTTVIATLFLAMLCAPIYAQKVTGNAPADFLAAQAKFDAALQKADTETIAAMLTDDFLRTPPASPNTTKTQWLEALRTGAVKYLSIHPKEANYRMYGDTVIGNAVTQFRVSVNGQTRDETLRLLSVWVKQNGRWMFAAVQGNPMPAQQAAK